MILSLENDLLKMDNFSPSLLFVLCARARSHVECADVAGKSIIFFFKNVCMEIGNESSRFEANFSGSTDER